MENFMKRYQYDILITSPDGEYRTFMYVDALNEKMADGILEDKFIEYPKSNCHFEVKELVTIIEL